MASMIYFVGIVVLFVSLRQVHSQYPNFKNLEGNLYSTIVGPAVCFRLTNDNSQIGCSAGVSGVQGNVWYVGSEEDLTRLLSGDAPHTPYVAFVDGRDPTTQAALTNKSNLLQLQQSERVVGVVVAHITENITETPLSPYSPLDICDNSGFGLSGTCNVNWNPYQQALGLFYQDFGDFPIMAITSADDFNTIYNCWSAFSSDNSFPLCAMEMRADMSGAADTETCIRRSQLPMAYFSGVIERCQPLGDYSPWGTPFDLSQKNKSVVMVTSKLDALSLFPYELSVGGGEAAGIVVLLAAAEAIGRLKREEQLLDTNSTIFFTLFHGESWDYIGSSRMVFDMETGAFTHFTLDDISHYLELSHVGLQIPNTSQPTFYAHMNHDNDDSLFRSLSKYASQEGVQLNLSQAKALPPSSLLRFLRSNSNITAAVLGDYDQEYSNRFYGSRFDDIFNIVPVNGSFLQSLNATAERLAALSTVVARTALALSGPVFFNNSNAANATANSSLVKDLIQCFLQNYSCLAFQEAFDPATVLPSAAASRYTGVWGGSANTETTVTQNLLSYYLGVWSNTSKNQCTGNKNYTFQAYFKGPGYNSSRPDTSGVCVLSNTGRHDALSPTFSRSADGTWVYDKERTADYSSWAESRWTVVNLRVYVSAGVGHDVGIFLGGVVVFALSILLSIQLYRKGRKVFL